MTEKSVYDTPQSSLQTSQEEKIYRKKKYVVYDQSVEWPSRCFKCNSDAPDRKSIKLTYVNPWIYLSILVTPILTIILAAIFQKRFELDLPMCDTHLQKRKRFVLIQWCLVALLALLFGGSLVTGNEWLVIAAVTLLLVLVVTAIAGRLLYVAKFKKDYLWVRGAGKEFVNSLQDFDIQ